MNRDFLSELKTIINNVDCPKTAVTKTYNIHKRSIPISLDRVVLFSLTRDEADKAIIKLIRKEAERRKTDSSGIFFYFDVIPSDALPAEKNVYYNEGPVAL